MYKVIILYAPDEKTIVDTVNDIEIAFNNENCITAVKAAKNALIPDIAASEIVILGSKAEGKRLIHSDFKEIIRSLRGINLAGRIAGIFSFDQEETFVSFKQALNDSDITVFGKSLLIKNGQPDSSATAAWAKKILTYYKDGT